MESRSLRIGNDPERSLNQMHAGFSAFRYEDGYKFSAIDLGTKGVKVELNRAYDIGGAVILPPEKVRDCGRWLLQTIGLDHYGLPSELTDILARLINHKKAGQILQRGDKKKIRDALKVLRRDKLKLDTEGKLLRLISNNAI